MKPPFRRFGSKVRLAPLIVSMLPAHHHYVEPFAGSAAVLFAKPRSKIETLNDLDDDVVNLFNVIRNHTADLARAVHLTPYSRTEYESANEPCDDPVERARRWLFRSMSCQGNDKTGGWSRVMSNLDAPHTPRANIWANNTPDRIVAAAERLRGVQIESRDWAEIVEKFDRPGVVFFVDPPYMEASRNSTMGAYSHEMTNEDHGRLIAMLRGLVHAAAVVTHYPCELYDSLEWDYTDHSAWADSPNNGTGASRRTERIYCSSPTSLTLFGREPA